MYYLKRFLPIVAVVMLIIVCSVQVIAKTAAADTEDIVFIDVNTDAWYAEAINYVQTNGLMNGTTDITFEPESSLTRAMLVTVLYRIENEPSVSGDDGFSDTINNQWYSNAILWATGQGLINGYGNNLFGPNDNITQEQLDIILTRYCGQSVTRNIPSFSGNAVPATRAQAAAALLNLSAVDKAGDNVVVSNKPKVLVAYFSRYGNTNYGDEIDATTSASVVVENGQQQGTTELIARMIAEQTGGDLHLIETASTYPTDFNAVVNQNHQEIAANTRPALSSAIDVSEYDVIFVGYPVWASTAPTPVLSFLESLNLSGKTVIPFCTHDGYGAGSSYSAISRASGGANVLQGLAIEAVEAANAGNAVQNWLNALPLPENNSAVSNQAANGETAVRIIIDNYELEGVLYDNSMARQFIDQLPQTITMTNYGGREVYGSIDRAITVEGEGQLYFDDGDITYCPSNNTAAIFYSQSSRPDLTMRVYPIGKFTSDLSIFPDLPSRVEITFEIK